MSINRPINVLLTVPSFDSKASPYREMMGLAKYLPHDEIRLTICALRENDSCETIRELEQLGVRCLVARFRPRGRTLRKVRSSLRDQAIIDEYGPFDIQHSLDFTASPFEAVVARLRGRRFVFHQRNMNENASSAFLRLKIRFANRIIALSESGKRLLIKHGAPASKLEKIYNGIDTEDFSEWADDQREPSGLILSVGHIVPRKRHEDVIRAFSILAAETADIRLGIAGRVVDAKYFGDLQQLVQERGLSDRVEFLGNRSDIPQLMKQSVALVLCSESEAFGWVILEAMAAGLPVVASAVDGPKEIIDNGNTGILVATADVEGYACALRTLLADRLFGRLLAENARHSVEARFSARAMAGQVANVYRELVS